jgi:hypothetical protein
MSQIIENISNNGLTMTVSYTGTATLTVTESTDNVTYTAVTLTGKTFTPTAGRYIKITLSSGTVSLVKLEDGSVATDGWHPYDGEFGGEVQGCLRYCIKVPTIWDITRDSAWVFGHFRYSFAPMRVTPSLVGGSFVADTGNAGTVNAIYTSTSHIQLRNIDNNWTTGVGVRIQNLILNAEL